MRLFQYSFTCALILPTVRYSQNLNFRSKVIWSPSMQKQGHLLPLCHRHVVAASCSYQCPRCTTCADGLLAINYHKCFMTCTFGGHYPHATCNVVNFPMPTVAWLLACTNTFGHALLHAMSSIICDCVCVWGGGGNVYLFVLSQCMCVFLCSVCVLYTMSYSYIELYTRCRRTNVPDNTFSTQ